jgi:formylmethanofuran dehydrogenase subunit E
MIMQKILAYTFDEYAALVRSFHGSAAPWVMIGGFMIDLVYRHLPPGGLYDVVCETARCLPDAVQLLTPCSIGNRWLKIIDTGRYALTFYEKRTGAGARVYLDCGKLDPWYEIKEWYLKLTPKEAQNAGSLLNQIREAGTDICSIEEVRVSLGFFGKKKKDPIAVCPACKEAYRSADGAAVCPACRGGLLPYPSGHRAAGRSRTA